MKKGQFIKCMGVSRRVSMKRVHDHLKREKGMTFSQPARAGFSLSRRMRRSVGTPTGWVQIGCLQQNRRSEEMYFWLEVLGRCRPSNNSPRGMFSKHTMPPDGLKGNREKESVVGPNLQWQAACAFGIITCHGKISFTSVHCLTEDMYWTLQYQPVVLQTGNMIM